MRDCFNWLEDSSSYSTSVLQANVAKNTSSITGRVSKVKCYTYQGNHVFFIMATIISLFSNCSTLYRLEVMSGCCNNLLCIFIHIHILPLSSIQSKTNGSTNSKTTHQFCLPLRHYCMVLLAFNAPSSNYLAKRLTHLLV